ncbi:selenium cofactor biosynthesis protein YqeC [Enterococcus sp. AD013-P3]|uniref:selenium cofactor biosynthesis protein YqeC n=1 Tax=Enterococcus sp. AD013-P3 TaxID=3411036 RepID=UPI003B93B323
MADLKKLFGLNGHQVIAVIGSGGKTSLCRYLANSYKEEGERVLVGTTTKIAMPPVETYNRLVTEDFARLAEEVPGITVAGEVVSQNEVKKLSLPRAPEFQESFGQYDKVILEADGSRQLPLKGWSQQEPVILPETTATILVIPISGIGLRISEETVHRLPLFLKLTGAEVGDALQITHLQRMIEHPQGILRQAAGTIHLFFNQGETVEDFRDAAAIFEGLSPEIKTRLQTVIVGSALKGSGVSIWQQ